MDELSFTDLNHEESRTYWFASGHFKIEGVRRICVRPSGSHRLETEDGRRFIVPAGWIALQIVAPKWEL